MKIGLYNLEPKIVNAAMMKVSTYHKQRGDEVEFYKGPLAHDEYDRIYAFSIFTKTPKHYITKDMIKGGTGFDVKSRLPDEIEQCEYDYSLYPDCDFSLVWFSQGCIRNCPFCIVRQKEGYIHQVKPKVLNRDGRYIKVMDNNFFACPSWRDHIKQLQEWGQPVEFDGVDVRLLDQESCEALKSLKHEKQIHIAWDNPREDIVPKLKEVFNYIKPYRFMSYVLIGYWSTKEEDLMRIKTLDDLGVDPYGMSYDKPDGDTYAEWVSNMEKRKIKPEFTRSEYYKYLTDIERYINGFCYKKASFEEYDPNYSYKKWRVEA